MERFLKDDDFMTKRAEISRHQYDSNLSLVNYVVNGTTLQDWMFEFAGAASEFKGFADIRVELFPGAPLEEHVIEGIATCMFCTRATNMQKQAPVSLWRIYVAYLKARFLVDADPCFRYKQGALGTYPFKTFPVDLLRLWHQQQVSTPVFLSVLQRADDAHEIKTRAQAMMYYNNFATPDHVYNDNIYDYKVFAPCLAFDVFHPNRDLMSNLIDEFRLPARQYEPARARELNDTFEFLKLIAHNKSVDRRFHGLNMDVVWPRIRHSFVMTRERISHMLRDKANAHNYLQLMFPSFHITRAVSGTRDHDGVYDDEMVMVDTKTMYFTQLSTKAGHPESCGQLDASQFRPCYEHAVYVWNKMRLDVKTGNAGFWIYYNSGLLGPVYKNVRGVGASSCPPCNAVLSHFSHAPAYPLTSPLYMDMLNAYIEQGVSDLYDTMAGNNTTLTMNAGWQSDLGALATKHQWAHEMHIWDYYTPTMPTQLENDLRGEVSTLGMYTFYTGRADPKDTQGGSDCGYIAALVVEKLRAGAHMRFSDFFPAATFAQELLRCVARYNALIGLNGSPAKWLSATQLYTILPNTGIQIIARDELRDRAARHATLPVKSPEIFIVNGGDFGTMGYHWVCVYLY